MSKEKKIFWIIIFNSLIVISEIFFGIISNSFALIADALHNTGDVLAIAITYMAIKLGAKKTTFKYTFGFIKAEMMAAFTNTMFLFITMLYMIYESINRFLNPEVIEPGYMIVVGTIAVIANGVSAYILHSLGVEHDHGHDHSHDHSHEHNHHHHGDANIQSAYLHMLSDALISVGVVVAGIFIYYFKIYYIDSVLTIIFSIYILKHSYPLLKKSFLSLMDVNTTDVSQESLDEIIKSDKSILEYNDLHISRPSSKFNFISFHIVLDDDELSLSNIEKITHSIKHKLEHIGFNHILIQVDSSKHLKNQTHCDYNGAVI
ncbi:cation diffusion facilitator family transporter [Candidatus Sulfurimonas baltica]|uniref:Cation transporter n=1 Tax=Candidatus Sulfurimonas baltica TaxID=2740404 RepID=A0A7S7RNZ8_9BACT|nr:cation diffusion facilitator family transporter [Candidatus Sulfurimonas baltica]QOY53066.1 cation transporter [Candidatus Sulfurimonas baltica]